jgi:hypothetical protein
MLACPKNHVTGVSSLSISMQGRALRLLWQSSNVPGKSREPFDSAFSTATRTAESFADQCCVSAEFALIAKWQGG